jgi:hypothetical protein
MTLILLASCLENRLLYDFDEALAIIERPLPSQPCGREALCGIDACQTGETLVLEPSSDHLSASYDLSGDACVIAATCTDPSAQIWVSSSSDCERAVSLPAQFGALTVCLDFERDANTPPLVQCSVRTTGGAFFVAIE